MKLLTLDQSLANPEWVAAHMTELREIFPLELVEVFRYPAPANVIVWAGHLALLGVSPESVATALLDGDEFGQKFTLPLIHCGVVELVDTRGNVIEPTTREAPTTAVGLRRRKASWFELLSTQKKTDEILEQEPSEESKALAGQFINKLFGKP